MKLSPLSKTYIKQTSDICLFSRRMTTVTFRSPMVWALLLITEDANKTSCVYIMVYISV